MRLQQFAGLVLGSAAFLSMAVPSFAFPALTTKVTKSIIPLSTRNRLPDLTTVPQVSGRVSYLRSCT